MTTNKVTRKNSPTIKVYCLPEEKTEIEKLARQAGKTASSYLLEVGQGYKLTGIVDLEQVRELARVNGDLGRLGGLLKLWLTDDIKTRQFDQSVIHALLGRIEKTQDEMAEIMKLIVKKRPI